MLDWKCNIVDDWNLRKSALSNIWSRSNNVFEASLTENILRNKIIILFYVWEFSADYIQILFYWRTAQKDKKFSDRLLEVHTNMWMLSQITLDVPRVFSFWLHEKCCLVGIWKDIHNGTFLHCYGTHGIT